MKYPVKLAMNGTRTQTDDLQHHRHVAAEKHHLGGEPR